MLIIELTRDDLFPFCKKVSLNLLTCYPNLTEVDKIRLIKEKKISTHDFYRADIIYFTDNDGSKRVLKNKKKNGKKFK